MKIIVILMCLSALMTGCVPANYVPTKTSLELQAIQAKDFETTKAIGFASTLSVLLDLGHSVTSSDIGTGYIAAKSPTQNEVGFAKMIMKDSKATAFIEELAPGKTKIRLNFVNTEEWSGAYGNKLVQDTPVEDPTVYNNAFSKIQEAIFIRTPMKSKTP